MRRQLLLLLFSLPILMSVALGSSAQAQSYEVKAKSASEAMIVQLVKSRYPKAIVTRLVIVDRYGLYSWVDGETGGQAMVSKDVTNNQWQFVRGTGGMLGVKEIVRFGVPQSIATQLVAAMQQSIQANPRLGAQ